MQRHGYVGLVVSLFFFFGVDSRLWVAGGGGGVNVCSATVVVIVVLEQKKRERERINNVLYCMMVIVGYIILFCKNIILISRIGK